MMQQIGDFLAANPWIVILLAFGFICWIVAVRIIFTSPKFLRKWLWLLLTLLSFSWSWNISPNTFISIGIPVGAFYVLWFWRFGRSPTAEERAKHSLRVRDGTGPKGTLTQIRMLAIAYILASIASIVLGFWCVGGAVGDLMLSVFSRYGQPAPPEFKTFYDMIRIPQALMMVGLCGLFIFLSFRPYWWGKLICAWAALSWLGFSGVMCLLAGYDGRLVWILSAGAMMVLAIILHQVADPRFSGSYLRNS
ncbi:hypothetical protein [Asticcacaulis taihuensis]|uniref:hypothetical protein n=1 Tax=Asticcacaulis taihuensis TaxID=260084 RepID=UPI003F7C5EEE